MKLQELYERLSYGELSNLSIASEGDGTIQTEARPRVLLQINEGLLKLHSRFVLKEQELFLQLHEENRLYYLRRPYAVNYTPGPGEVSQPLRYILDTPENPFIGDLIKVMRVYDECGDEVPLNDDGLCNSLFTPKPDLLQVPTDCHTGKLSLMYQARHPKLTGDLNQEIDIPDFLWGALSAYVAYKIFSNMNSQDGKEKAQEHLAFYELECENIKKQDIANSSISTTHSRFEARGWT